MEKISERESEVGTFHQDATTKGLVLSEGIVETIENLAKKKTIYGGSKGLRREKTLGQCSSENFGSAVEIIKDILEGELVRDRNAIENINDVFMGEGNNGSGRRGKWGAGT